MTEHKRIWLGEDRALFLGELPATQVHAHAAPVLLIGLSGTITLTLPGNERIHCHSALLDAGVEHALDSQGELIASLYLEPDAPETRALKAGILKDHPVLLDPLLSATRHKSLETRLQTFDLANLLPRSVQGQTTQLDERIARSLNIMRSSQDARLTRQSLAGAVHLSESRFNHLFRAEMGISFRRYRSWSRLRSTFYSVAQNQSLTSAALDAGLHDSAHLSRLFRDMIGLAPSQVLKNVTRMEIV
ncbi:MAG: AraC family transcriptional regulator [Pseudomonadaceae bacterium]|nr:MAG: AraC family transcriptional regulator [Pseudomonadaceae bacterium]